MTRQGCGETRLGMGARLRTMALAVAVLAAGTLAAPTAWGNDKGTKGKRNGVGSDRVVDVKSTEVTRVGQRRYVLNENQHQRGAQSFRESQHHDNGRGDRRENRTDFSVTFSVGAGRIPACPPPWRDRTFVGVGFVGGYCSSAHRCGRSSCSFCSRVVIVRPVYLPPACPPPTRVIYTTPVVVVREERVVVVDNYVVRPSGENAAAWCLIGDQAFRAARDEFAYRLERCPEDAGARIGYAIALGQLGYSDDAARAMRRAVCDDVYELERVPMTSEVRWVARELLGRFEARARDCASDVDASFMVAAINYMLGDNGSANDAIREAIRHGDDSTSTRILSAKIEAKLCEGTYASR